MPGAESAKGDGGDAGAAATQASVFGALPSPLVAVDDMRATAKWTLAVVGAVGAALISGGPLVAVGNVHGAGHAIVAGLGLLIALAGIGVAVWYTSDVLMPRLVTPAVLVAQEPEKTRTARLTSAIMARLAIQERHPLDELRAEIKKSPEQFFGVLARDINGLLRYRAMAVNLARQLAAEKDPARREVIGAQLQRVARNASRADPYVRWLLVAAHAELVKAALRRSRVATMAGGVLVIVGAVLFFGSTGSNGPTYVPVLTPAVTATPNTGGPHPTATR